MCDSALRESKAGSKISTTSVIVDMSSTAMAPKPRR